ncbi:MAG: hypothetical protein ACJARX_000180 [Psychroserpens sp.]|uniref:hypothetical protein n=1 Tax=Psychroserpens sp. TaxID=2020870 RepID=UPI0039E3A42A
MRQAVINFLNSKKEYVLLAGLAAGIYPFLRYLNIRFFIVNSPRHILFFGTLFLVLPAVTAYLFYFISTKVKILHKYSKFVLPFVNFSVFSVLLILITVGVKKKLIVLALVAAVILAVLLYKHLKKVVIFQFILGLMAFSVLAIKYYHSINQSYEWMDQPDDIESVIFKKKPNIYVIQPDGYASFSELRKGYYDFDNSNFESFLHDQNFKLYTDFRSNYESTLYSNSSLFAMRHHQYLAKDNKENEFYDFRSVIIESNPVLSVLERNNYKTHLLLQEPYFVLGKSDLGYDYCNIQPEELSFFSGAFDMDNDIKSDLNALINNNEVGPNFYFIEKIKPWHVENRQSNSKGIKEEGDLYLKRLIEVNEWLVDVVSSINQNDPNSLIVIIADHGGYVGFDYQSQSRTKTLDRDLLYSIFGSALAVKWPNGEVPTYDNQLKTSVNLFRVLFSYLGENDSYLKQLEHDKSYLIIEEEAPAGVYETIDDTGEIVFEKVE